MTTRFLLASDMDGTVVPLDDAPERAAEIKEFNRLISTCDDVALAYVTGRHLELGLAGVKEYRLPEPDIFVCDVGTTIHVRHQGRWGIDQEYRARMKSAWQGLTGADIARRLEDIKELTVQEEERQQEFKQSYYVPAALPAAELTARIREALAKDGIKANIIYSVDTVKHIGLVDILPHTAAKDYALFYLRDTLGLDHDRVVYAGDSGNDMLAFVSGFNAVVVANTADEVKREVRRTTCRRGIGHRVYFASHKYVRGVMEGCFYFRLFPQKSPFQRG